MAAGLGFKDFTTGEVLTAADVDGYLMQGVWVFASAAARDAAVTSPQEGNFAYLKDTNVTTYYTGSAWANLDTTGMTNPMTTTGDIIYSSSGSTPARLGIGSTGNVLTVAGGVPSWAAPAGGGGMTFINRTTFSNVASQAFNSVFTSTYDTYFVNIETIYAGTASDDLLMQLIYNTSTTQTSAYYSSSYGYQTTPTLITTVVDNGSSWNLCKDASVSSRPNMGYLYINHVGNTSEYGSFIGQFFNNNEIAPMVVGGLVVSNQTYDGFVLSSSSSNITGAVTIFGVNKS